MEELRTIEWCQYCGELKTTDYEKFIVFFEVLFFQFFWKALKMQGKRKKNTGERDERNGVGQVRDELNNCLQHRDDERHDSKDVAWRNSGDYHAAQY
jgi:hypothetical protein